MGKLDPRLFTLTSFPTASTARLSEAIAATPLASIQYKSFLSNPFNTAQASRIDGEYFKDCNSYHYYYFIHQHSNHFQLNILLYMRYIVAFPTIQVICPVKKIKFLFFMSLLTERTKYNIYLKLIYSIEIIYFVD